MEIIPWLYGQASKGFRNEPARKIKNALRPVKHAIVGKQGIYQAMATAQALHKERHKEIKVVFDIGAAIGEAALPLAKAFPNAEIYCFEPLPASYEQLVRRTKSLGDRVHCFNYGLYNEPGELTFYVQKDHHDASSLLEAHASSNIEKTSVPVKRLDDVCRELGIDHVDFMKIDVEGVEKEMIAGAKDILQKTDYAFVEIVPALKQNNRDYVDTFGALYDAGLILYGVYNDFFFARIKPRA